MEINRAVVQLNDAKSGSQSDAAAARTGGKEKLKNLLLVFDGDSFAGIGNANFGHFAAPRQFHVQFAAGGHGFRGVEHQIQHRLLQKVAVGPDFRDAVGQQLFDFDSGLVQLWLRDAHDVAQKFGEIGGFEFQFDGAGEIQEALYHRVEAVDFLVQNLHGLARFGVRSRGQGLLQIFQPQPHRIERVLYFVGNASGDAANSGETFADL